MDNDWKRGSGYVKAPKIVKELGVGKDGYQTGGVTIEATNPKKLKLLQLEELKR